MQMATGTAISLRLWVGRIRSVSGDGRGPPCPAAGLWTEGPSDVDPPGGPGYPVTHLEGGGT